MTSLLAWLLRLLGAAATAPPSRTLPPSPTTRPTGLGTLPTYREDPRPPGFGSRQLPSPDNTVGPL